MMVMCPREQPYKNGAGQKPPEISTGDEIDRLFDIVRRIEKIFSQLWEHLELN